MAYWTSLDNLILCSTVTAGKREYRARAGVPPAFYQSTTDYKIHSKIRSLDISGDTIAVALDSLYLSTDQGVHFGSLGPTPQITRSIKILPNLLAIASDMGLSSYDFRTHDYTMDSGNGLNPTSITSLRSRAGEVYALAGGKIYLRKDSDSRRIDLTASLGSVVNFDVADGRFAAPR